MRVATAILFVATLFAIVACVALAQQHEHFYSGSSAIAESEDHHHHTSNSGHSNDATAIVTTTDSQLMAELRALPISRLRRFLSDRDAKCDGCVEKRDLVAAAIEVMHEPTHDDYLSAQLSLEHDLTGPLAAPIPAGGDLDVFYEVPDVDEPIGQSPIARPALKPLSDAEVVALLQLYHMRHLLNEGVLKCGVRYNNGTQYCNFAAPTIVKASE